MITKYEVKSNGVTVDFTDFIQEAQALFHKTCGETVLYEILPTGQKVPLVTRPSRAHSQVLANHDQAVALKWQIKHHTR